MKNENSKIKIGVVGAGGRIGTELLKLIQQEKSLEPSLGIGNKSVGFINNVAEFTEISLKLNTLDILIDFSSPTLFLKALEFCQTNKIPLVSGTTGLTQECHDKMKVAGRSTPILWAPNMSLGIAILKKSLKVFKSTPHFDYQIEEWHHRHKKDSPSGTALFLQSALEEVIEKKCPPTMVMRVGGIFGVHKVYAASEDEMITFEHTALNRTVFARGALVGASWLMKNQKNGVYSMDDVIS